MNLIGRVASIMDPDDPTVACVVVVEVSDGNGRVVAALPFVASHAQAATLTLGGACTLTLGP